jgi:hypothetical protein
LSSGYFEAIFRRFFKVYAIIPLINSSMAQEHQPKSSQEGRPSNKREITPKEAAWRAEMHRDGMLGKHADLGINYLPAGMKMEISVWSVPSDEGNPSAKSKPENLLGKVGGKLRQVFKRGT